MVQLRPILVKKIPSRTELDREINQAMKDFNKLNKDEFDSTIATFQNKFAFEEKESFTPDHKEVSIETDNKIYHYLERGTSVRYATMGPRFRPKTAPKRIAAVPGQSDVLFVSTKRPRPGIKPRKFSLEIKKKLKPKFFEMVSEAVLKFAEEYNG